MRCDLDQAHQGQDDEHRSRTPFLLSAAIDFGQMQYIGLEIRQAVAVSASRLMMCDVARQLVW